MTDPDLIAYIRQQSAQGVTAQTLREELLASGWREEDIENALHDMAAGLHPVTAGASLHEDLAQVRGIVSHLASRVQRLEARLAVSLAPSRELASGALPKEMLPAPRKRVGAGIMVTLFIVGAVLFGWYMTELVVQNPQVPTLVLLTIAGISTIFFLGAFLAMRRNKGWLAALLISSGSIAGAADVWVAWRTYQVMEAQTAIGVFVLIAVLVTVMGRWINRFQAQ